jgi:hypothetical protein
LDAAIAAFLDAAPIASCLYFQPGATEITRQSLIHFHSKPFAASRR